LKSLPLQIAALKYGSFRVELVVPDRVTGREVGRSGGKHARSTEPKKPYVILQEVRPRRNVKWGFRVFCFTGRYTNQMFLVVTSMATGALVMRFTDYSDANFNRDDMSYKAVRFEAHENQII